MTIQATYTNGLVRSVLGSNYDSDLQINWGALDPNRFFPCTYANLGQTTVGNAQTAAGSHVANRFFYCTDTGAIFYDNGSAYVDVTVGWYAIRSVLFDGDFLKLTADATPARMGTAAAITSGDLYALLGNKPAMWYMTHNFPMVMSGGNPATVATFGTADSGAANGCLLYVLTEGTNGGSLQIYYAPAPGAGIKPTFNAVPVFTTDVLGCMTTTPPPVTTTAASYSAAAADRDIIVNYAGTHTLTLQAAAAYKGRTVTVKTILAQLVNSASSNVVPLVGGAAGTAILAATAGKWARLTSDGTNWIIMEGN